MLFGDSKFKKIAKYLKLDKPLVVFDLETTGLAITTDKIIELAYIKVWDNKTVKQDDILLNPEMEISPSATAVHGIKSEDLKDKPTFTGKAQEFWQIFSGCYYSGFNVKNFDLPILRREFVRVGMDFNYKSNDIIDTREIFQYMSPRTLSFTYEYYVGKKFKAAHAAMADTDAAAQILVRQLEKYKEIRDWEFLKKITYHDQGDYIDEARNFYWLRGEAYFAFSKYKDKPLAQIAQSDPGFLRWMLTAEFSEETKNIVSQALDNLKKEESPSENNK